MRTQVGLSLSADFVDMSVLSPRAHHSETVARMLDEVVIWAGALRHLRDDEHVAGTR